MANPLATILTVAMLLRYTFELPDPSDRIERAVGRALDAGLRTADIMAPGMSRVGTEAMGDAVVSALAD